MPELYEVYIPEEQEDEFWEEVALDTAWARMWAECGDYDDAA